MERQNKNAKRENTKRAKKGIFMKGLLKLGVLFLCLLSLGGLVQCSGSSGASSSSPSSPPVDIPSPVSHLSISSPDASGAVRVAGAAGFADTGATVTVTATSNSSSLVRGLANAEPLATSTSQSTTANADGSFRVSITASINDTIAVVYTLSSTLSQTSSSVPQNRPAIPEDVILFDVSVDGTAMQAGVIGNDGVDGFVYVVDINNAVISDTITLSGATDAYRIAADPQTGYFYVIDDVGDKLWEVSPDTGVVDSVTVTDPFDVAAGESGNFAIIAHGSGDYPASYYAVTSNTATTLPMPTYPPSATHVGTDFVDVQWDGTNNVAATVTLMSDDLYYVYKYVIQDQTSSFYAGEIPLYGEDWEIVVPGGIALFNEADEVLVTDQENERVIRFSFSDSTTATEILVGLNPTGVTVDDLNGVAYVVNSLEDTVSVISLASNQEIGTVDTGLLPLEVSVDSSSTFTTPVAVSALDNTVTIIVDE